MLKEKGYTLQIIEFSDYILPNLALSNQDIIANFFQHEPYLNNYNQTYQTSIKKAASIHIEPNWDLLKDLSLTYRSERW